MLVQMLAMRPGTPGLVPVCTSGWDWYNTLFQMARRPSFRGRAVEPSTSFWSPGAICASIGIMDFVQRAVV